VEQATFARRFPPACWRIFLAKRGAPGCGEDSLPLASSVARRGVPEACRGAACSHSEEARPRGIVKGCNDEILRNCGLIRNFRPWQLSRN
jgi:hypothetical protein